MKKAKIAIARKMAGSHEGLGHALRLRALYRRRQRLETDIPGEPARFPGKVTRAVVGQPFD